MRKHRKQGIAATVVITTLLASACSSSSSGGNSKTTAPSSSTGSAPAGGVLGAPKKATGTPIKVGVISDGNGATVSFGAEIPAIKAASTYANDYLNGFGGHPISLVTCLDQQTPSGTTDCANQMISAHVAMVMGGNSINTDAAVTGLAPQGIPYVVFSTVSPKALSAPTSFVLADTIAIILGGAIIAKQNKITQSAIAYVDVPTNDSFPALGTPVFQKAGSAVKYIKIPVGAADATPQLQAAGLNNINLVQVSADPGTCALIMRGLKTLNYKGRVSTISFCDSQAQTELKGSSVKSIDSFGTTSDDPSAVESKLFQAVMAKYQGPTTPYATVSGGYAVVVGIARALASYSGPVTSAGLITALGSAPAVDLPLSTGVKFQCNGKVTPSTPRICSTGVTAKGIDPTTGKVVGYKAADLSTVTG